MAEQRDYSLQRQIQWRVLGLLGVIFLVLWLAATLTIHKLVEHYLVTRLDHDAQMLAQHLHKHQGRWQLDETAVNPIFHHPNSGHYFVIRIGQQQLTSPSLNGFNLWTPLPPPSNLYETLAPAMAPATGLETTLVRYNRMEQAGETVHIFTAESHMPIQRYLYGFDALFALLSLLALGGTAFWLRRQVSGAFARLRPLEQQLQASQQGEAPFQPPAQIPQEVRPLVQALENSLSSLQQQLQRYRHTNADLAHALKTPLHVIYQHLNDPCLQQCPQLRTRLSAQLERMQNLIDRSLKSANVAGTLQAGARFRLDKDLQALVEALGQVYSACQLQVEAETGTLPLEREDGYELLGNLLDNACKWAQHQVRISVFQQAEQWCLCIEDDGPGVPEAQRQQLTRRGARLDEQRSGSGLGLSIAAEIVRRYDGTLTFERSALGGLKVCVRLPMQTL